MGNEHGRKKGRPRAAVPRRCRTVLGRTDRENAKVQLGASFRENAAAGVRTVRNRKPEEARRRETGDVQLPRLHPHLWEEEGERTLHGPAADDSQTAASEIERGEGRTQTPHA